MDIGSFLRQFQDVYRRVTIHSGNCKKIPCKCCSYCDHDIIKLCYTELGMLQVMQLATKSHAAGCGQATQLKQNDSQEYKDRSLLAHEMDAS